MMIGGRQSRADAAAQAARGWRAKGGHSAGRIATGLLAALVIHLPAPAADLAMDVAVHTEGFVLELGTPRASDRGRCTEVGVNNFARLPDREVWLVARAANRAVPGARPLYDAAAMASIPAHGAGAARVCFEQIAHLLRARHDAPATVELAVYRVSGQERALGRWSGPGDDRERLSEWLPLPDALWRKGPRLPSAASSRH